jgi:hypothetical protein
MAVVRSVINEDAPERWWFYDWPLKTSFPLCQHTFRGSTVFSWCRIASANEVYVLTDSRVRSSRIVRMDIMDYVVNGTFQVCSTGLGNSAAVSVAVSMDLHVYFWPAVANQKHGENYDDVIL